MSTSAAPLPPPPADPARQIRDRVARMVEAKGVQPVAALFGISAGALSNYLIGRSQRATAVLVVMTAARICDEAGF